MSTMSMPDDFLDKLYEAFHDVVDECGKSGQRYYVGINDKEVFVEWHSPDLLIVYQITGKYSVDFIEVVYWEEDAITRIRALLIEEIARRG